MVENEMEPDTKQTKLKLFIFSIFHYYVVTYSYFEQQFNMRGQYNHAATYCIDC